MIHHRIQAGESEILQAAHDMMEAEAQRLQWACQAAPPFPALNEMQRLLDRGNPSWVLYDDNNEIVGYSVWSNDGTRMLWGRQRVSDPGCNPGEPTHVERNAIACADMYRLTGNWADWSFIDNPALRAPMDAIMARAQEIVTNGEYL